MIYCLTKKPFKMKKFIFLLMAIFTMSAFGFVPNDVDVGDSIVQVDSQDQPVIMLSIVTVTPMIHSNVAKVNQTITNDQLTFDMNVISIADLDDDVGWTMEDETKVRSKHTKIKIGSSGGIPYNCS